MVLERFFPRFSLEFEQLEAGDSLLEQAAAAVAGLVPVSREFYEADIKVEMRYRPTTGNTFSVTIAGLASPTIGAIQIEDLEPGESVVKIKLGYYGGDEQQVLEGVVLKKTTKLGDCSYETTLTGVEKTHYLLQQTCLSSSDESAFKFQRETSIKDILDKVLQAVVGVELDPVNVTPADPSTQIPREWSFQGRTALSALEQIEERLRRINAQRESDHYSLLVRDGTVRYARANGPINNAGQAIRTAYNYEESLVDTEPVSQERSGQPDRCEKKPASGSNGSTRESKPIGYDFVMLGDPRLRPGDSIDLRVKIDGRERTERLTIESITHDFSRTKGYRCTGRALQREGFARQVYGATAPSPESVGQEINNVLARSREQRPAVSVGDITDYFFQEHLAHVRLGLQSAPNMTSPSIQVPRGAQGFAVERRPVASPFAWNLCGLIVPIYPGMRTVALHNGYLREDALLSGFVWTEEMQPPPNEVGDYWLCLPLDVPEDRPPNSSDQAANDLITGDGKRVIQVKGMRITIGEGLLENLGSRPADVGADDELQIEHSSGAQITIRGNEITMAAGGRTLSIANGRVSVT